MKKQDLIKKLGELDQLRTEILGQVSRMSNSEKIAALEAAQPNVKLGSPEHAALLAAGYGMTIEQAETIIKERAEKPELWPYEQFEKARAMLEAFNADPKKQAPTSKRPPWRVRARA